MTNTPRFTTPVNPGGEEQQVPAETPQTRPTAEKVTPSQQGQFKGALERKTGKEAKKGGEIGSKKASTEGGIFQLASTRKAQGEGGGSEMATGEESGGEMAGQGFLPNKKASTLPTEEQTVAAGQLAGGQMAAAQAQLVGQTTSPVEPSQAQSVATPAVGTVATPTARPTVTASPTAPKTGVTSVKGGEEKPAFHKLIGEATPKVTEEGKEETGGETVTAQAGAQAKPVVTPTLAAQVETPAAPAQSPRAAMIQLITQAAEAIATFVSKDVTSTVVTIRQPPIFEGATLTVTEYSSAPKQFNITFENLTPEARRMIESVANQQQLKQALVDRGYTVQNILIESTPRKAETPLTTAATSEGKSSEGKEEAGEEGAGAGAGETEGGVS
jgi:hypothetical protein